MEFKENCVYICRDTSLPPFVYDSIREGLTDYKNHFLSVRYTHDLTCLGNSHLDIMEIRKFDTEELTRKEALGVWEDLDVTWERLEFNFDKSEMILLQLLNQQGYHKIMVAEEHNHYGHYGTKLFGWRRAEDEASFKMYIGNPINFEELEDKKTYKIEDLLQEQKQYFIYRGRKNG